MIASVLFDGLILTLIRLELTQVIGLLSEDAAVWNARRHLHNRHWPRTIPNM